MDQAYTTGEQSPPGTGGLMLYRGTQNRPRKAHLIYKNQDTTLCGQVDADRTQKGRLNGNKTFEFKGLNHVLGQTCKHCQKILKQEIQK